jgi:hypothetical protein
VITKNRNLNNNLPNLRARNQVMKRQSTLL